MKPWLLLAGVLCLLLVAYAAGYADGHDYLNRRPNMDAAGHPLYVVVPRADWERCKGDMPDQ